MALTLRSLIAWAVLPLLVGCGSQGSLSRRHNPLFENQPPPEPTLLTAAVACLESHDVAAGGQRVRRATGFGALAVQSVNRRLARIGDGAPAVSQSFCRELTSPNAADPNDWTQPAMPPILSELLTMSGAGSVIVPVVRSRMKCDRKPGTWRWGEAAYSDESGQVDCHDDEVVFGAFLYNANGVLIWKAFNVYALDGPLDTAAAAEELLVEAPVASALSLVGG
jgi:hypothetical protein